MLESAQLPAWIIYCQALSTPAIALLACTIAYGQWKTAQRKIAYDLFEKRLAALRKFQSAVRNFEATDTFDVKVINELYPAIVGMKYLFGKDVEDRVDIATTAIKVRFWQKFEFSDQAPPDAMKHAPASEEIRKALRLFAEDEVIFDKYLRLAQTTR
ncbi:hypothetical protein ACSD7O_13985 [Methylorubrum extorquens]|uniref:hypothetical protein n=1 Tax=Methylorubrum extorquens TaxID=408 RepID=UPI003F6333BD